MSDNKELNNFDFSESIFHIEPLVDILNSIGSIDSDKGTIFYIDMVNEDSLVESELNRINIGTFEHEFELTDKHKYLNIENHISKLKFLITNEIIKEQFKKGEDYFNEIKKEVDANLNIDVDVSKFKPRYKKIYLNIQF